MNQALQNISNAIQAGAWSFASGSADTAHALSGTQKSPSFDAIEMSVAGALSVGTSPIFAVLNMLIEATGGWG